MAQEQQEENMELRSKVKHLTSALENKTKEEMKWKDECSKMEQMLQSRNLEGAKYGEMVEDMKKKVSDASEIIKKKEGEASYWKKIAREQQEEIEKKMNTESKKCDCLKMEQMKTCGTGTNKTLKLLPQAAQALTKKTLSQPCHSIDPEDLRDLEDFQPKKKSKLSLTQPSHSMKKRT